MEKIDGNAISVSGGEAGVICCADPSCDFAPMLRAEFETDATHEIARARLYVTARGIYEMYINGERMGDDWFAPGNAEYIEHMPYQTYDVTDMLAAGAQPAEGWWSSYMTFTISNYNYYDDGTMEYASLFQGECYNARKKVPG